MISGARGKREDREEGESRDGGPISPRVMKKGGEYTLFFLIFFPFFLSYIHVSREKKKK